MKWKPDVERDRRSEVVDFGVGNFADAGAVPPFRLRFGVEAKRAIRLMQELPSPASIVNHSDVQVAFHHLYYQAQDQAKAAFKGGYPLVAEGVQWILLVGPYWVPVTFCPFTESQLSARAHKPSDSTDWCEQIRLRCLLADPPLHLEELYLLSEDQSFRRMEEMLVSTDGPAAPFIEAFAAACAS